MSNVIHQEVVFDAPPARVYRALTNASEHAEFTGGPAEISEQVGGAFSCHGGRILGLNLELVPDSRIVQAWRPANWPEGVYSIVRLDLEAEGSSKTRLKLTHSGLPDEGAEHIEDGWKVRYWQPLAKYLA